MKHENHVDSAADLAADLERSREVGGGLHVRDEATGGSMTDQAASMTGFEGGDGEDAKKE